MIQKEKLMEKLAEVQGAITTNITEILSAGCDLDARPPNDCHSRIQDLGELFYLRDLIQKAQSEVSTF